MKRILKTLTITLVVLSFSACAHAGGDGHHGRYRGNHHGGHHGHNNWVVPLIVGGVVGSIITNQRRPVEVYESAPVYVPNGPYTHRPMYKAVDIYIPECNCYRTVHVQIN